ncbi:MAG: hypothetical protein ACI8ZX_001968 [Planctomycetota bacterium]|jgi:hypothetical protein
MNLLELFTFLKISNWELFGIEVYDKDFWELLFRLGLNTLVTYFIILKIYSPTRKDREYVFTFMVLSPIIFFVINLFLNKNLNVGFAFGLFAIFSILRYRTAQVPVKEMTYMFVVISLAVINAMVTKKVSYSELFFTNFFILGIIYVLERQWNLGENTFQTIYYEKIENIKPENEAALLSDLSERTGREIDRYEIVSSDFMRDMAKLRVYFKAEKK